MRQLNFPAYQFNIKKEGEQVFIFDEIRKKWIVLTPEEWVRQHVVFYLVGEKGYKAGLIGIEKSLKYNGLTKRFDIVCYNKNAKPLLIVECKAPEVAITESTLDQALRYNSEIQAEYIVLSNGLQTIIAKVDFEKKGLTYLKEIPEFV